MTQHEAHCVISHRKRRWHRSGPPRSSGFRTSYPGRTLILIATWQIIKLESPVQTLLEQTILSSVLEFPQNPIPYCVSKYFSHREFLSRPLGSSWQAQTSLHAPYPSSISAGPCSTRTKQNSLGVPKSTASLPVTFGNLFDSPPDRPTDLQLFKHQTSLTGRQNSPSVVSFGEQL